MARGLAAAVMLLGSAAAYAGSTVYAFDLRGDNDLLTFDVAAPADNVIATLIPYDTFCLDFDSAATTLYAINEAGAVFGTVDQLTGAFTAIGPTGLTASRTGLRVDPTDETYYVSALDAVAGNQLYKLNPLTGAAAFHTNITGLPAGGIIIDIAIDAAGNMYGNEISTDSMYAIDKNTGAATLIGPTGFATNFAQGMDFDYATGKLHATLYLGGGAGRFVEISTVTGAATVITDTTPWNKEMEMAIKAPIPEPASMLLLALGGLALARRR